MTTNAISDYSGNRTGGGRRQAPRPSTALVGLINGLALSTLMWGAGLALWLTW